MPRKKKSVTVEPPPASSLGRDALLRAVRLRSRIMDGVQRIVPTPRTTAPIAEPALRSPSGQGRPFTPQFYEEVQRLHEAGATIDQMAHALGASTASVTRAKTALGIQRVHKPYKPRVEPARPRDSLFQNEELHKKVRALHTDGWGAKTIGKRLHVSPTTVHKIVRLLELPVHPKGGSWRKRRKAQAAAGAKGNPAPPAPPPTSGEGGGTQAA